jgi:uncharacterized UPF0160 family protein
MISPQSLPLLVTHSGTFHFDDAFAYTVLKLALELKSAGADHILSRTRSGDTIASADYVWDVGNAYDARTGRFDHHQRGAPVRDDGVPLSAAGLVWRHHGLAAVKALLSPAPDDDLAEAITAELDRDVVHRIDEIDNGIKDPEDTLGLSSLVADFNPLWNSGDVGKTSSEDADFIEAARVVESFLRRRANATRARLDAEAVVRSAYEAAPDKRLLELDRKMPWQDAVTLHRLDVLLAVYPVSDGNWAVDAMPDGSGTYRKPMPKAWAGLRDAALVTVSGVSDAVFVHPQRFLGVAGTRNGALAMAHEAIAQP